MQIGKLNIPDKPVILAPMEDITDHSFRFMCKKFGADLMFTEFISSDGLIRDGRKSVKKLKLYKKERPIGIQLYGHLIEAMVDSAKISVESSPDLLDLNFGCPVKKVARRGAGAGMMRTPELMEKMTHSIVEAVDVPVTAKTRLGWDEDNKNVLDVSLRLQNAGVKAITIHGRTKAQLYKGTAAWDLIGEVKNHPEIEIPVIGNGDVKCGKDAEDFINHYNVDGVMVGRASIGRPWIFKEIKHYLKTGEVLQPPDVAERVEIAKEHFEKSMEFKEFPRSVFEMRKHFTLYFKGIPDFKPYRMKLVTCKEPQEIRALLKEIKIKFGDFRPVNPYAFEV